VKINILPQNQGRVCTTNIRELSKVQALQAKAVNLLNDEQFKVGHLEVRNMDSGCSGKFQFFLQILATQIEQSSSEPITDC